MNERQQGLAGLLIVSGIDLLLAALCSAVGILVLLIGSSAGNIESRPASKPYASWWMLVVISPERSSSSLICLEKEIQEDQSDSEVELIYRGTQWGNSTCKLTLNAEAKASRNAFTRVMLYANDQCWSNIKADPMCSDITSATALPVDLHGLVAIDPSPLPTPSRTP